MNHKIISMAVALLAPMICASASAAHDYGLADIHGKILLPPVYHDIRYVSENCFRVTPKENPKTVVPFFVNQKGEKIPAPAGADMSDDDNSLTLPPMVQYPKSAVSTYPKVKDVKLPRANIREALGFGYYQFEKGSAFGVCDQHGTILFPPSSDGTGEVRPLSTNRFLQTTYDEQHRRVYKLFDENAKLVNTLPPGIVVQSSEFHDGLLLVETDENRLTGYLNKNGEYQIKPGRFVDGRDFNEGFANVIVLESGITSGALIDTTGKIIAGPLKDGWFEHFEDGLAQVTTSAKLCGMVDHNGAFVIPPEFSELFRKGKYIVGLKEKQLQLFSASGELLKKLDRSITYVEPTGNEKLIIGINSTPSAGNSAKDSTANTKYGVVTLEGKTILDVAYDHIGTYQNGYAVVGTKHRGAKEIKQGLLGPNQEFAIPQRYDGLTLIGNNVILFNSAKNFDKIAWLPSKLGRTERTELWRQFLSDYNVIGMKRDSVLGLLGAGDGFESVGSEAASKQITYLMSVSNIPHCGNSPSPSLQIVFDNKNLVAGWRLHTGQNNEPWIRTDMIYESQNDDYRLVPKESRPKTAG